MKFYILSEDNLGKYEVNIEILKFHHLFDQL